MVTSGRWVFLLLCLSACRDRAGGRAFPIPGEGGDRVMVEVLNATGQPGLARSATAVLRRAGIDVVAYGNVSAADVGAADADSTRILVRRGPAAVGDRIRRALGAGTVRAAPDATRLVDASVLVGADFHTRSELHP